MTLPDPAQMEAALRLIGGDCERLTRGRCPDEPNWSPYAAYTADRWCDPCIARAGLAGTLPDVDRDQFNARVRASLDRLDGYDPTCCRFPKSCSATVYDPEHVDGDQLEPR